MSGLDVCFQLNPLIPAKAGIQGIIPNHLRARPWIPACAGASGLDVVPQQYPLMTCEGRYPGDHPKPQQARPWIPACAGTSGLDVRNFNTFRP